MTITELPGIIDLSDASTPAHLSTAALCNTGNSGLTALFFSEDLGDISRAKAICARCPMLLACLEGAIEREEPWGVWGGQLFRNGRILSYKRPRGRPPKNPRPEDLQDQLLTA